MRFRLFFVIFLACLAMKVASASAAFADPDPAPKAAEAPLTDEILNELFRSGENFVRRFPPADYFYIGLGRSAHVVLGYVDALGIGPVRYIPMSLVKNFYDPVFEKGNRAERLLTVKNHIARFLPTAEELGTRKILVVDYVDSGAALRIATDLIANTLYERGQDVALAAVALHGPSNSAMSFYKNQKRAEEVIVPISAFRFYETMVNAAGIQAFASGSRLIPSAMNFSNDTWVDGSSPVSSYDWITLKKGDDYSEHRPEYDAFLEKLREHGAHLQSQKCRRYSRPRDVR